MRSSFYLALLSRINKKIMKTGKSSKVTGFNKYLSNEHFLRRLRRRLSTSSNDNDEEDEDETNTIVATRLEEDEVREEPEILLQFIIRERQHLLLLLGKPLLILKLTAVPPQPKPKKKCLVK